MYLDQVDELEAYLKINSKMKNLITLIIPSLLFFMIFDCEGTNNIIRKWRRNQLFEPEITSGLQLPQAKWFEQTLDHFHPTDGRVWKQR